MSPDLNDDKWMPKLSRAATLPARWYMSPNFLFYPDYFQRNIIPPMGHERTLTNFEWYFEQPGTGAGWESKQQSIAFGDQVQQENIALCEAFRQRLGSRAYDQGRFSVRRENSVHHFPSLVDEALRSGTETDE